jgi:hypothetical protein
MKFLVVVLALSGLCAAEPEAEPQVLLAPSPYLGVAPFNAPAPFLYNGAPLAYNAAPLAYNYVPAAPLVRVLTPSDCVTPGGCNARELIDAGLAGRKKREAEADPALLYSGLGFAYNDFAYANYAPYNYAPYNFAPYNFAPVAPVIVREPVPVKVVEDHTRPVTYTHLGAHPINPTTVLETDRRISTKFL